MAHRTTSSIAALRRDALAAGPDTVSWRREFHRHPELGFEETRTSERVRALLAEWNIPFVAAARTGVVATLSGGRPGPTVALRADMDALPVTETTGLPFASENPGVMHACGHDGHTATLLGVARTLSRRREAIAGRVVFIFQPCEEKPPGGAPALLKEGALRGVDALLGFHFMPYIPPGTVWCGTGPVMATTDEFSVSIEGRGGHGSAPHMTSDPLLCAARVATALQDVVSRRVDPLASAVVSVCRFSAGSAFNIIPAGAELAGTVRTLDDSVRSSVLQEMERVVAGVCAACGCRGTLSDRLYSPACVNDADLAAVVNGIGRSALPAGRFVEYHPVMGGEDFAYYGAAVRSCYLFFGIGPRCGPLHSGSFRLDETVLPGAVETLSVLAYLMPEAGVPPALCARPRRAARRK